MAAIELERLERRYGERVALAGVSVRVEEGQTLAVLGGNGAGKTTLLRVLAGLLRPHGGSARVLGASLPDERWKLPAQVGYLGHEPLLYRELSGRENLRYHADLHGVPHSRLDTVLTAARNRPIVRTNPSAISRKASFSVSQSLARSFMTRRSSSSTNRAPIWIRPPPSWSSLSSDRASGRTRVLVSHDVQGALEESDVALGLRAGRPAPVDSELYR